MKKLLTLLPLLLVLQLCSAEIIEPFKKKIEQLLEKNSILISGSYGMSFTKNASGKIVMKGVDFELKNLSKSIEYFFEQPITLFSPDVKWGVSDGTNIIDGKYDFMVNFTHRVPFSSQKKSSELAIVSIGDKYGYINKSGDEVVPVQFDSARDFVNNVAAVKKGKWGFIDKTGKIIIDFTYDDVGDFGEGLAYVVQSGNKGFINKQGEWVLPIHYDRATRFQEGVVAVKQGDKYAVIDRQGKELIAPKYNIIYPFNNGLAMTVNENNSFGFINKKGETVVPFIYRRAMGFYGKVAAVVKNEKWGFINKKGKTILPFNYDSVILGTDNIYLVSRGDKYGYIDSDGKIITELKYAFAKPFKSGFAKANDMGDFSKSYIIDTQGRIVRTFSESASVTFL